jgi:hypothetical protein
MRRTGVVVLAVVAGLLAGGGAGLAWQDRGGDAGSASPAAPTVTATTAPAAEPGALPASSADPGPEVLLAWTAGGLPPGFGAAVDALPETDATTVVRGGTLDLASSRDSGGMAVDTAPEGMAIPLDVIAIDPVTYPAVVPDADQQAFRGLLPGEALLGSSSAQLRGLEAGGQLVLQDGTTLRVAGVVDDSLVGAAEVVVRTGTGAPVGTDRERYVLFTTNTDRAVVEAAVRAAAPDVAMRVRAPGETPFLRSSDAVLPQVLIKQVFGEFAYDPTSGRREFRQEPGWAAEHVVSARVPLLGQIRCHRSLLPALRGAMEELAENNLGGLVGSFDGCYNPRLVAVGGSISRHAWGAAVDLNFSRNPTGASSAQDARLVEVMERWGFVSGDDWLVPDSGHFEFVGLPL